MQATIKSQKLCVLCEYWEDPFNRHLKYIAGSRPARAEYDSAAKEICLKSAGGTRPAGSSCGKFKLRSALERYL
ncbi:hypothetical protein FACS1894216_15660 [Synergistales bacterium]|nr:hypothetical protein FACS1894216_15660 [Synergistales bacterium]